MTEELAIRESTIELSITPVMDLATAKARLAQFQEFVAGYMVPEEDFGIIPGTAKPTLLKPGADKLCEIYGLSDEFEIIAEYSREDWTMIPPLFDYTIRCTLRSKRTGALAATGLGSCNSYEGKYRWRDLKRTCPKCGQPTIIKGKEEFGGGYICWKKEGKSNGCGAKFSADDKQIIGQAVGRTENDDIATLKNTILKMSKKRCLGSNTSILVSSSSGVSRCRVDNLFQMWNMNNREPLMLPMKGGWGRVVGMTREERPQAVRIRLADGSAVFCSGEHVWPTTRGEQLTADIQVGDVMIRTQPELAGQMTVDESIAWTVGCYLAEGHCDRGHVKFTVNADEIESFIPTIEKAASIVGGRVSASRRAKGNVGDIIVTGPAFSGLMQQFSIGSDCYGKHLSKYAWRQGKDFIRLLLKGYLDGDGHLQNYREGRPQNKWILGFTGENFALADDLRCISAILGHRHSIRRGVSTCGGTEFPTFEGWISFDEPRYNGKNLEEVTEIRVINQKSVLYDIEVEDPHLFLLPNGITSHNSKIDATLSATRSSGIFTQDLEDIGAQEGGHAPQPQHRAAEPMKDSVKPESLKPPGKDAQDFLDEQEEAKALQPAPRKPAGPTISEAQQKRFFAIATQAGWKKDEIKAAMLKEFRLEHSADIMKADYERIVQWFIDGGGR